MGFVLHVLKVVSIMRKIKNAIRYVKSMNSILMEYVLVLEDFTWSTIFAKNVPTLQVITTEDASHALPTVIM